MSPEIDKRLEERPELVSANFVIPYPPGFPIMVPGQVIKADTIEFMRKLDVKEIHGYNATLGLKLIKPASSSASERRSNVTVKARLTVQRAAAPPDRPETPQRAKRSTTCLTGSSRR